VGRPAPGAGGVAAFAWASTLSVSSFWAHPAAMAAFPAPELAWMAVSPLAVACVVAGTATAIRRTELSPRVLAAETRLAVAACATMAAFLGGCCAPAAVLAAGAVGGAELVSRGALPGRGILERLDGACSVSGPPLEYSPPGPSFSGTFYSAARRRPVGYTIAYPPRHRRGDELPLVVMLPRRFLLHRPGAPVTRVPGRPPGNLAATSIAPGSSIRAPSLAHRVSSPAR
jgi:hypothetical protein